MGGGEEGRERDGRRVRPPIRLSGYATESIPDMGADRVV